MTARVAVTEHHADRTREFSGPEEEVARDLRQAYPFLALRFGQHASLSVLVRALDAAQAYTCTSYGGDIVLKSEVGRPDLHPAHARQVRAMLGLPDERYRKLLEAGAFLARVPVPPQAEVHRALSEACGDPEVAVAMLFGLSDPGQLAEVKAVADLRKSEPALGEVAKVQQAVPAHPLGADFAEAVNRAAKDDRVFHVSLGGKHSGGAMVAVDGAQRILLKPGSGGQSPALGAGEEPASQAKREAAFYAVARLWGLAAHVPECHLLTIGGAEYAALRLVDKDFETLNDLGEADRDVPRRVCEYYRARGVGHRWAALDYAAGNVDRHGGNVMARPSDGMVYLIDHGSCFAGVDFHPEADPGRTYVPVYLRECAPSFQAAKTDEARWRALPRLNASEIASLEAWLQALADPTETLATMGVEPGPTAGRLRRLRMPGQAADLRVNALWTL